MEARLEQTILKNLIQSEEFARKCVPFIKSDYFTDPDEDEEIDSIIVEKMNPEYLRGIMMGLVIALDTEKGHGEHMGRSSHGEILHLFDAANAFLIESLQR